MPQISFADKSHDTLEMTKTEGLYGTDSVTNVRNRMEPRDYNSNGCLFKKIVPLVNKEDAARIFGVSTKTIDNYIKDGLLPVPIQFGLRQLWHPEVFDAFLRKTFMPKPVAAACEAERVPSLEEQVVRPSGKSAPRDSSPAIRQKQRQSEKMRALNT